MTHQPVVRALDVGHANVKYSTADVHGNLCYKSFPSIAPAAVTRDLSAGAVKQSEAAPEPSTPERMASHLRTLLAELDVAPPYVLVGTGGAAS